MNKINVFLDDIRKPSMSHNVGKGLGIEYSDKNKWVIVRDYFEFIDLVNKRFYDIDLVSFDHDLACYKDNVEYTGKTAVDYLINYCLDNDKPFPNWYAHTDNTSGRQNIRGTILNYLDKVENVDISNVRYFHNGILNGVAI
jgi:hypothetical protein